MVKKFLALDIGEKRIGVAVASSDVKIAASRKFIAVDGSELDQIKKLLQSEMIDELIVGYPRNQSGEITAQTQYVERFIEQLADIKAKIVYQDESLTSVKAEEILKNQGKPYEKGEIDSLAASLILQDYLELQ